MCASNVPAAPPEFPARSARQTGPSGRLGRVRSLCAAVFAWEFLGRCGFERTTRPAHRRDKIFDCRVIFDPRCALYGAANINRVGCDGGYGVGGVMRVQTAGENEESSVWQRRARSRPVTSKAGAAAQMWVMRVEQDIAMAKRKDISWLETGVCAKGANHAKVARQIAAGIRRYVAMQLNRANAGRLRNLPNYFGVAIHENADRLKVARNRLDNCAGSFRLNAAGAFGIKIQSDHIRAEGGAGQRVSDGCDAADFNSNCIPAGAGDLAVGQLRVSSGGRLDSAVTIFVSPEGFRGHLRSAAVQGLV